MKLLIESALIFFGTLLAAALVALGEPRSAATRPYLPVPQGNVVAPILDAVWPERITALQP